MFEDIFHQKSVQHIGFMLVGDFGWNTSEFRTQ